MTLIIDNNLHDKMDILTGEDYQTLTNKIKTEGFNEPIVVWNNKIVDGRTRYQICNENNITFTTRSIDFKDDSEARLWIINNQLAKRNITDGVKFELVMEKKQALSEKGKANIIQKNKNVSLSIVDKVEIKPINTQKEIARELGWSSGKVATAEFVYKNADIKTKEAIRKGTKTFNKVYSELQRQLKKEEHKQKVEKAKVNPQKNTFNGPYDLILADPCWKYDFSETDSRKVENQYETATVEEIIKHKPNSSDNSVLFLWATAPKLLEALEVMKGWGFDYVTNAIWDKESIGMGYWFRGQHELLLVGRKGNVKCPLDSVRVSSVFKEKKSQHSKKPECVYKWIENAFPDLTKLEMYCRTPRKGWSVWGNEI